jgi:hypothetical protein
MPRECSELDLSHHRKHSTGVQKKQVFPLDALSVAQGTARLLAAWQQWIEAQ